MARAKGRPSVYNRVTEYVRLMIRDRGLQPGDPLPSERELAQELGLSHVTVRRGLSVLLEKQEIERVVGRGTFVASPPRVDISDGDTVVIAMDHRLRRLAHVGYALEGVRQVLPQDDIRVEILAFDARDFDSFFTQVSSTRSMVGMLIPGWISDESAAMLHQQKIPFVLAHSSTARNRGLPAVVLDYKDLLCQAMDAAQAVGHARFAFLGWNTGPHDSSLCQEFRDVCGEFGVDDSGQSQAMLRPPEILPPTYQFDVSRVDLMPYRDLLENATCLITSDEWMALAAEHTLEKLGRRVPGEVSMISLHDFTPYAHQTPLSAPDSPQAMVQVFHQAALMLSGIAAGRPPTSTEVVHRCPIILRDSLCPPKVNSSRAVSTHPVE